MRAVCTSEGGVRRSSTARGWYYPMHCKNMRKLTCTDRPYKANHLISFGARMSILSVQRKVPYAVAI